MVGGEEASTGESLRRSGEQMALTRKLLEGMGIDDRQAQAILDAHDETISGLKAARDKFKEQAEKVPDLQRQLEEAEARLSDAEDWKAKYEGEHKALRDYQAQVSNEKAEAAKAKAYRDMLEAAGIDPNRIKTVMRVTDLSQVQLDDDGKLKDGEALAERARVEWSDFVLKTKQQGSNPATPPKRSNDVDGADPEIAKRMQERHDRLYGKNSEE